MEFLRLPPALLEEFVSDRGPNASQNWGSKASRTYICQSCRRHLDGYSEISMEESSGSRVVTSSEYRSEMCGRELLMFAKLSSHASPLWDFRDAKPSRKRFVARLEQATTVFFQTATPSIARGEEGGFIPFFHLYLKSEIVIIFLRVPRARF